MDSIAQEYRAHSIMPNSPSRRTLSIESTFADSKIVIAVVLYGGGGGEGERVHPGVTRKAGFAGFRVPRITGLGCPG